MKREKLKIRTAQYEYTVETLCTIPPQERLGWDHEYRNRAKAAMSGTGRSGQLH